MDASLDGQRCCIPMALRHLAGPIAEIRHGVRLLGGVERGNRLRCRCSPSHIFRKRGQVPNIRHSNDNGAVRLQCPRTRGSGDPRMSGSSQTPQASGSLRKARSRLRSGRPRCLGAGVASGRDNPFLRVGLFQGYAAENPFHQSGLVILRRTLTRSSILGILCSASRKHRWLRAPDLHSPPLDLTNCTVSIDTLSRRPSRRLGTHWARNWS